MLRATPATAATERAGRIQPFRPPDAKSGTLLPGGGVPSPARTLSSDQATCLTAVTIDH
jgi:hypothetical protein